MSDRELLLDLKRLMGIGLWLGWAILVLQVVFLMIKLFLAYRERRFNREVWVLLQIVKEWASSARIQTKETQEAVKEVRQQSPVAERHVLAAVEAVPEATATRVIERIKEDSDPLKKGLPPPT